MVRMLAESSNAPPRRNASLAPWQERKAKALLAERMADDISIVDVARECRLSRGHFCKAFKQTTGQSPYAWLTHYRISTAQALLRSTQRPLADIALACGFGDQSHLTRMFSRVVGTPPGSWRRSLAR
jgi:AraC family transcriptional regulator